MNLEDLRKEHQRALDLVATAQVGSDQYFKYLDAAEALQKQILAIEESSAKVEKEERELNLKEVQSKTETQLRQEELKIKKKDSRRQVGRTVLVVVAGLVEVAGLAFFEEIKPLVGTAWKHVIDLRPRL